MIGVYLDDGCGVGRWAVEDIMHRNGARSENTIMICSNRCLPLAATCVIISPIYRLCTSGIQASALRSIRLVIFSFP